MAGKPLRVGIDCRMIERSGVGSCLRGWLGELPKIRLDWHFELFGDPIKISRHVDAACTNIQITAFDAPVYSVREQIFWLCRGKGRPDVLWVPHFNIPIFWAGPLMATIHDTLMFAHPEFFGQSKLMAAKLLFKHAARNCAAISFVSAFTEAEFSRWVGVPRGFAQVIHNGVSPIWFEQPAVPPPRAGERPTLLFVGNLKRNKNLGRLVAAFRMLIDEIPHKLLIVGNVQGMASYDREVLQAVGFLPPGRVELAGSVADDMLQRFVRETDLLVQPSIYEGFGLPPIEGMAAARPVAVARAASLPEICGDAAVYFDPLSVEDIARVIRRALHDTALRRQLMDRGPQRAHVFTWRRSAEMQAGLIERAAVGSARKCPRL
jgi:glycosyltransferase involved in cell wall biosynthesis